MNRNFDRGVKWLVVAAVALFVCSVAHAGDDPSIQGKKRSGIQSAMASFIADQQVDDWMVHYDPVNGKLIRLKLVKLHSGIVQKGHFYVSCADFVDEKGTKYDFDFLVVPKADGFRVNQALVHKVAGEKRKYHVEQTWPGLF